MLLLTGMFNSTSVVLSVNAAERANVYEVRISGYCSGGSTGYGYKIRFGNITTGRPVNQSCPYMADGSSGVDTDEKIRFAYVDTAGNLYLPAETGDYENAFWEYFTSSSGINCNTLSYLEDTECWDTYMASDSGSIVYYE